MDTLLGLLLVSVATFIAWRIIAGTKDLIHPIAVFTVVWIGVFGVGHFRISKTYDEPYYAEPFGLRVYVVVLLAYLIFVGCFALVATRAQGVERVDLEEKLTRATSGAPLELITLCLFGIATLTTAYFVRVAGAIPLFSPDVDILRRTFKLPLLGYLFDLHIPAAMFGAIIAARSSGWILRMFWMGLASASLLMLMFGGVRVSALTAMVWIGVYFAYARPRVSTRAVVLAGLLAVVVSVTIETARRSQFIDSPELLNPRVDRSPAATIWAHTGASFKNLQLTIEQLRTPLNMGLTSYQLPKTIVPSVRDVDAEMSNFYGTHNTPTFLGFLYFDFGWAGLFVMPGLYGALVAFVYGKFRRAGNLLWLIIYIDFFLAVLLSFRTHRFFGNNLFFFAGVALLVQFTVRAPTPEPLLETDEEPGSLLSRTGNIDELA